MASDGKTSGVLGHSRKQTQTELCSLFANASVFIGVTTNQIGNEPKFIHHVTGLFRNYRKRLLARFPTRGTEDAFTKAFDAHFYKPTPYVLLSGFDLALFAIVDGFEFGVQKFHACEPMLLPAGAARNPELPSFPHRTIVGPALRWNPDEDPKNPAIIELATRTFLKGASGRMSPLPMVGICQIEVNSSFLIGAGGNFLRALAKAIDSLFHVEFKKAPAPDGERKQQIIVMESYSWHELTVLYFGYSFAEIRDFVMRIREMTLLDVGCLLCRPQTEVADEAKRQTREDSCRQEWQTLLERPDVYGLDTRPRRSNKPLSASRLSKRDKEGLRNLHFMQSREYGRRTGHRDYRHLRTILPFGTHVVFNSTTTMGFWAGLLEQALSNPDRETRDIARSARVAREKGKHNAMFLMRNWMAKAGHTRAADRALSRTRGGRSSRALEVMDTAGRADFCFPCSLDDKQVKFRRMSSRKIVASMLDDFRRLFQHRAKSTSRRKPKVGGRTEPSAGIQSVQSTVGFYPYMPAPKLIAAGHASANDIRERFALTPREISQTDRWLHELFVPQVVIERVHNAIALYNDGVKDNFLFSSFLELGPYLRFFHKFVKDRVDELRVCGRVARDPGPNAKTLPETINLLMDCFETGWRNRFHGGWRLGEVSDFTLEYKGGIQQLVSAVQIACQNLFWLFNRNTEVLAIIKGEPAISVYGLALYLNLFDIFTPEFFAARVGHELSEMVLLAARSAHSRAKLSEWFAKRGCGDDFQRLIKPTTAANPDWSCGRFPRSHKFFDQVFADLCNFYTVFLGDARLYAYWFLGSFVMDPLNGDVDRSARLGYRPNDEQLAEALERLFLVVNTNDGMENRKNFSMIDDMWGQLFDSSEGRRSTRSARIRSRKMLRSGVGRWRSSALRVIDALHAMPQSGAQPKSRADSTQVTPADRSEFTSLRSVARRLVPYVKQQCLLQGRAFDAGVHRAAVDLGMIRRRPWLYDIDLWLDCCDTVAILHGYLELLAERCGYHKSPLPKLILPRSESGKEKLPKTAAHRRNYAPLLFDVANGNFAHDAEFRREYFKWRCTFVRSLGDMAEKQKIVQAMMHRKMAAGMR